MKTMRQVIFELLFYVFYLIETILKGRYPFTFNDKETAELYFQTYSWSRLNFFYSKILIVERFFH
jgi:hypothetical protein